MKLLSEALEGEIWNLKKNGPRFDAYTMPRMAQYLGRWILHSGWYPDRKVRLYDRGKAKWVGDFVHESVQVRGRVGHFESNLLHFTCDSLSEHLRTIDRYTTLAAEELVSRKTPLGWGRLIFDPLSTFLKTYFIQAGFLDGVEGLTIAYMAALYTFLKYAKARNMSNWEKMKVLLSAFIGVHRRQVPGFQLADGPPKTNWPPMNADERRWEGGQQLD